mmetsp:Transcript_35309/g.69264  ORF Transcript_35309/g.69264 Transcript_35309/m.69264 type:complete len:210 (-) Transcript_35309:755-1384(-)
MPTPKLIFRRGNGWKPGVGKILRLWYLSSSSGDRWRWLKSCLLSAVTITPPSIVWPSLCCIKTRKKCTSASPPPSRLLTSQCCCATTPTCSSASTPSKGWSHCPQERSLRLAKVCCTSWVVRPPTSAVSWQSTCTPATFEPAATAMATAEAPPAAAAAGKETTGETTWIARRICCTPLCGNARRLGCTQWCTPHASWSNCRNPSRWTLS